MVKRIITQEVMDFIKLNYTRMSHPAMAKELQIPPNTVASICRRNNWKRPIASKRGGLGTFRHEFIKKHWRKMSDCELASHIGITPRMVAEYRRINGWTYEDCEKRRVNRERHADAKKHPERYSPSELCALNLEDLIDGERLELPEPTEHRPGSWGKIQVLEQRLRNGQALYHPLDNTIAVLPGMLYEKD